jgi:hypothetical protein
MITVKRIFTFFMLSGWLLLASASSYASAEYVAEVLRLVNVERAKVGLNPLCLSTQLTQAAQVHSNDMATNNFMSHTGSDGSSAAVRVDRTGYKFSWRGENVAAGQASPAGVMDSWMNSPDHRANILRPEFTELGVGYALNSNAQFKHYWTQVFGTPIGAATCTAPTTPTTPTTPTSCLDDVCRYSLNISTPGFYVARVSLPQEQREGQWGLSINNSSGLSDGGFSSGSVLRENGEAFGFTSFYLTQPTAIQLEVQEYSGKMQQLSVQIKKNNQDAVFGPTTLNVGTLTSIPTLDAGYYVAAVKSPEGAARGYFGIGIYGPNIQSSVDIGGMIDPTSGLGFIGFPVTKPITVDFALLFGQNYSTIGSGQPNLEILRNPGDGNLVPVWSSVSP